MAVAVFIKVAVLVTTEKILSPAIESAVSCGAPVKIIAKTGDHILIEIQQIQFIF